MEYVDMLPEESGTAHAERLEATERDVLLRNLVDSLPEKESMVVRCRFFLGMTLKETGSKLGCSLEYVRQVESGALATLRKRWENQQ
jgi:RNA polymerase sigma factor (sigma-70 family)